MTALTSPYCTSADVALLVPNLVKGATDFSTATTPTKTAVDSLITKWVVRVEQPFAAVGYYIPFQEVSGESWPDWQTGMLALLNAVAVAGVISGPVLKPAPAIGDRRGYTDNPFTAEFKELIERVEVDGLGFRALTRTGSQAEQFVNSPIGPMTDYLMGYIDKTHWMMTDEYTATIEDVREDYSVDSVLRRTWDHLADRRKELIGI